ncbi:MAG: PLP-dependent aminotransferase family protein [Lachnospiraceae bacterium]
MLTYNLTATGSDSLYESLYKCIKNDILQGKLCAGEKLPSKRSFAKNLGISVITVENAYGQLSDEGYIYSMPKRGFYVSDIDMVVNPNTSAKTSADANLFDDSASIACSPYFADFSSNQTDSEIFPFTIWTKTVRSVLNDNRIQLMINPPCGGILPLRNAIARYLGDFRGMKVAPHQIIIGAGTEYLYGLLIQLLGKNLIYGVENPGYHKIGKICKSMGVTYRHVDLDESGVSIHELEEKKIDIIHTSPSHHFPTGLVMPVSRRYELLGWAAKEKERYIIEDDYDSELRLSGKPFPTLQSIDISGKVIYTNTFTKTLASTVRISYMVLPEDLAKRFYSELSFYSCTVSNFEQYTLAQFMENGSFEKHINRLRNYYQNKRDAILKELKSGSIGKYITIQEEEAGVHFLMHIQSDCTEAEIVEKAKAGGVKLDPLSRYYIKNTEKHEQNGQENPYENTYVMNYSSVNMENIKKVVQVLSQLG